MPNLTTGSHPGGPHPDGPDESGPTLTVGVIRETAPGERRVALTPTAVTRLRKAGFTDVLVEYAAGIGAWFTDSAYAAAGATLADPDEVYARADVLLCVGPVPADAPLRAGGQVLIGMLAPGRHPELIRRCVELGVTAVSLDLLPRTLSRAQSMDALTSQANVAGYKAVLVAAEAYGGFFPMLITAAGTAKPAQVLVLGAGVAGLQAIGTARRLGAQVSGYDIRPETRTQVESVGGRFLRLADNVADADATSDATSDDAEIAGSGAGGYARELTEEEAKVQRRALDRQIARFDVVITTAQVPGARPPVLVSEEAIKGMRPGSVVVDLAAGPLGGNVEGSVPDSTVVLCDGVTVIGAGNLPATMPAAASEAYARNVSDLLTCLVRDGVIEIDPTDEVHAAVVVTHGGSLVNPALAAQIDNAQSEVSQSDKEMASCSS